MTDSATAIVVGSPDDPLLTIRCGSELKPDELEELLLDDGLRRNLEHLLEQAPRGLVASAEVGSELAVRRYVLTFSKQVRTKLGTGVYSYMPVRAEEKVSAGVRALAVDTRSRKIVEQGRLLRKVNPAVVVAVTFQLASIATAQKYLADIEKRLGGIEQALGDLLRFVRHELDATVESQLRHLQRMASTIRSCDLTERNLAVYAIKLEDAEVDCGRIMAQLRRLFADEVAKFGNLAGGGSAREVLKAGLRAVEQVEAAGRRYLVAAAVRVTASEIRGAAGLHEEHALAILRDIERDLAEFASHQVRVVDALPGIETKLVRRFSRMTTTKRLQGSLRGAVHESARFLEDGVVQVREMIETTRRAIEDETKQGSTGLSVEVTLDEHDQVLSARRLLAPPEAKRT